MTEEEIDRVIQQADKGWSVWGWGQTILWLHNRDDSITLVKIEERLRALNSKTTFFVARSLGSLPEGCSSVKIDGSQGKFWLWICLQGPDEMLTELGREKKSIEQNLKDLAETGFAALDALATTTT